MTSLLLNLLIIFPKEFIKLIVKTDMMAKIATFAELNISIATIFLNTHSLRMV